MHQREAFSDFFFFFKSKLLFFVVFFYSPGWTLLSKFSASGATWVTFWCSCTISLKEELRHCNDSAYSHCGLFTKANYSCCAFGHDTAHLDLFKSQTAFCILPMPWVQICVCVCLNILGKRGHKSSPWKRKGLEKMSTVIQRPPLLLEETEER